MLIKKINFLFFIIFNFFCIYSDIKNNNITLIGIGRLGICTALCFEKAGFNVLGLDLNPMYIEQINKKTLNSPEPNVSDYLKSSKNFRATYSLDEAINFSDIYFILVATPSTPHEEAYDHSSLSKILSEISKRNISNKHIIICCTVFPGYTNTVGKYLLKDCKNVSLSYNPEFISQGNIIKGLENPDIVLIGQGSEQAGDLIENIYRKVCKNNPKICRMSVESAEITKLAINCFITTKIAFANMIGDISDNTPNTNKNEILEAIGNDSRIGTKYLKPGYGFGGPCFPRDNRALGNYAKKISIEPLIPLSTDQSNKLHAKFMVSKLLELNLNEYIFEDVNYKDNCNVVILEESQKLVIAQELTKFGKKVIIKDKKNVIDEVKHKFGNIFEYKEI